MVLFLIVKCNYLGGNQFSWYMYAVIMLLYHTNDMTLRMLFSLSATSTREQHRFVYLLYNAAYFELDYWTNEFH